MSARSGPFALEIDAGVATIWFERPPVNAFAASTYDALLEVVDRIEADPDVRVAVLAAPASARAWCGGADVNDFVGMNAERRKERYDIVNGAVTRFAAMQRPTIAAISGPVIGIGVLLAAACDIRFAAEGVVFACPEIDYGLIAGSARLLNYVGVPEGLVREMGFSGRRIPAHRMYAAGFLNDVVPAGDVDAAAFALARTIATKSLPTLVARKQAYVEHEQLGWFDAYQLAQRMSATLVGSADSQEGVHSFLKKRSSGTDVAERSSPDGAGEARSTERDSWRTQ